jgi:DNA-binding NarL/FixJ family response regulator
LDPALSPYEALIVALVADGWRNHVIAAQLGTTIPAVETALVRIYTKYGLDDEHDLDKRVTVALRATADGGIGGQVVLGDESAD